MLLFHPCFAFGKVFAAVPLREKSWPQGCFAVLLSQNAPVPRAGRPWSRFSCAFRAAPSSGRNRPRGPPATAGQAHVSADLAPAQSL